MKFISLFSGIGGLDLGLERAGMECVAQVEIDDFCQKVLTKHWPDVPKFKDVRNVGKHNLPAADVIAGGFPCQPHSYAGKRRGKADDRNLWPEYLRVIEELQPRFVIGENVPGLITTMLDEILSDLERVGYSCETFVIPAGAFNAPHWRDRVWIVAYSGSLGCLQRQLEIIATQSGEYAQCSALSSDQYATNPNGAGLEIRQGKPDDNGTEQPPVIGTDWDRNWLDVATILCRVDDGLPVRMDGFELTATDHRRHRLASLGNAVVPQVAEFIGRCIMEAEKANV
jgi:DNA (cytosine-5)-methyltransferase 1